MKKGISQQIPMESRGSSGENLKEMNKFLDIPDQPKLSQEDINHISRSITSIEIEVVIESPNKEKHRT
jgi:hypothetical protein